MIVIEKEVFNAELAAEVLPLARKCWAESSEFKRRKVLCLFRRPGFPHRTGYQRLSET